MKIEFWDVSHDQIPWKFEEIYPRINSNHLARSRTAPCHAEHWLSTVVPYIGKPTTGKIEKRRKTTDGHFCDGDLKDRPSSRTALLEARVVALRVDPALAEIAPGVFSAVGVFTRVEPSSPFDTMDGYRRQR